MRVYLNEKDLKLGDIVYFEMPPTCSGEYSQEVAKDSVGFFIDDPCYSRCIGYRINKPYWKTLDPITLKYED